MTQFEQGAPSARIMRRGGGPLPQIGIDRSLIAPGLEVLPPVDRGVLLAQQFSQAIGYVAGTAQAIGAAVKQQQHEDKVAFTADEGVGVQSFRDRAPTIISDIEKGKIVPHGGESFQDTARRVADEYSDGMSPGFGSGFHKAAVPDIVNALTVRSDKLEARARKEFNGALAARAQVATSGDDLNGLIDEFQKYNPDASRDFAASFIGGAAAEYAAAKGRDGREQMDAAISAGGLERIDPQAVQGYRLKLQHAEHTQEILDNQDAQNTIDDMIRTGTPLAAVENIVNNTKALSGEAKTAKLNQIDALRKEQAHEARRQFVADLEQRVTISDVGAAKAGELWKITDFEYPDPVTGTAKKITAKERTDKAMSIALAQEPTFDGQLSLSLRNDYTVPQWKKTIDAGAAQMTEGDLQTKDGVEPAEATRGGFTLYKQLRMKAGHTTRAYTGDGAFSLYETAAALQELDKTYAADDRAALMAAHRARTDPNRADKEQLVRYSMERVRNNFTGLTNAGDALADVERLARIYAGSVGMDPNDAVSKAADRVKSIRHEINGVSLPIDEALSETFVEQIPIVSRDVAESYVAANKDQGFVAGDFVLNRHRASGLWYLAYKDGRPAETGADDRLLTFSTSELKERIDRMDTAKRQAITNRTMLDANTAPDKFYKPRPSDFTNLGVHPLGGVFE